MHRRCLLILPRGFYGFASVLANAIQGLGYSVVVANDEYPENVFGKIISKLRLRLSHIITRAVLFGRFLKGQHYDLILVIKGRGLDARTAGLLKKHGTVVVGYHFDAFAFDRGPMRWRGVAERVCTFDYRDAHEHSMPLVELFTSLPDVAPRPVRRYRVSAVMRNHSQRLVYLDHVLRSLDAAGVQGERFIYILEAHVFSFVMNLLRHPLLYWKYRKYISRRPLSYPEYVAAISDSELTIDYAHPSQTGITIRCFEALSSGTRIISNNMYLRRSSWFSQDHFMIFDTTDAPERLQEQISLLPLGQPKARRRDVGVFLRDLLEPATLRFQSSTHTAEGTCA